MGRFLRKRRGRCGPRGLVPYREVAARMGREGGGRRVGGRWPTGWPLRLRRCSEGGLKFFEAGCPGGLAEQVLERWLAADSVDPLAHGVRHLAEPGVEDVENRLAGGLDDAFLTAFDEAFFEGEFFEEGNVGRGFVG